jgi:hypothetical protein
MTIAYYSNRIGYQIATPNPSINTDWRDKAAPAGYVKRYVLGRNYYER